MRMLLFQYSRVVEMFQHPANQCCDGSSVNVEFQSAEPSFSWKGVLSEHDLTPQDAALLKIRIDFRRGLISDVVVPPWSNEGRHDLLDPGQHFYEGVHATLLVACHKAAQPIEMFGFVRFETNRTLRVLKTNCPVMV